MAAPVWPVRWDGEGIVSLFKPLGTVARWRVLYEELLVPAAVGDIITYEAMGEILDLHPTRDVQRIRSALHRAAAEYMDENGHALESLARQGYQVVEPIGHVKLAHRQQRKATKALTRGHSLATCADLSNADPGVRRALDTIAQAFSLQMEINRRYDVRQKRLEEAMSTVQKDQERTDAELSRLRERLRQVEDRLDE